MDAKKKTNRKQVIQLDPLEAIRRLLIMQLLAQGTSAEVIANALQCDNSRISQIISVSAIQKQTKRKG